MNIAILCDFDETVAEQNIAHVILKRFGKNGWRTLQQQFREGTIHAKEYFELSFDGLATSRHEMQLHVRKHGVLRNGLTQFSNYCREKGIELAIVTHGLDFYVDALLDEAGLGWLPTYAVEAIFTENGLQYGYHYTKPICTEYGNCKCLIIEQYRSNGNKVVYIGDGISDLCPALQADFVFARSLLLEECQAKGITHMELHDFSDVITALERHKIIPEAIY